ncbi:MAG: MBL fold metallo-hydrolase [Deltaproteobacteria bacterium]|nr:MBL fold metallo-hydrolase [Deltaproteobacteria bacterium]
MLPDSTIWHLSHSAEAMKIDGCFFVFDYFLPPRSPAKRLSQGFIDPHEIKNERVFVLVSHHHPDHFHASVFEWKNVISDIQFVVSSDVQQVPAFVTKIKPAESLTTTNFVVKTYPSADEGVAFSIFLGKRHIYFSGDHAFWNWSGNPDSLYFDRILSRMDISKPVDIAFHVCDARLAGLGYGGIKQFAKKVRPKVLVPIHCNGDYSINKKVEKELKDMGFEGRFLCIQKDGEIFTV